MQWFKLKTHNEKYFKMNLTEITLNEREIPFNSYEER